MSAITTIASSISPEALLVVSLVVSGAYLLLAPRTLPSSFVRIEKIQESLRRTKEELDNLRRNYEKLEKDNERLSRESSRLSRENTSLKKKLKQLSSQNTSLREELKRYEAENDNLKKRLSEMDRKLQNLSRMYEEAAREAENWKRRYGELKEILNGSRPPRERVLEEYNQVVSKALERRRYLDTTLIDRILAEAHAHLQRGETLTAKRLVELADKLLSEEPSLDRLRRLYEIGFRSYYQYPAS